ncbi:Undecaprenyl-phosphate mannosyltransferase [Stieleria bergensis]|uniref:Undecaprenyl-phosphate mannosyltransferase n=1 Tax=Stieleria bergensis TaxID=2528025 RepID=A0A517SYL8_9BACT|nr:MAG: dolichyl-phosphate mannose synthase [Rhodopirellula sp. TMED11]QDT61244.1 Undecaprenyl-phosphate mannosyltransferase [Planctomycetes bacterium SV_7m_r]
MPQDERWLAALPIFNEVQYVDRILDQVSQFASNILVVDDGSTDGTSEKLAQRRDIAIIRHPTNRGYGAALKSAFDYTLANGFAGVVTLDADGQHQPKRIPAFIDMARTADIVSGSRYLHHFDGDDAPPEERLFINRRITMDINRKFGLQLTDSFCGFKAYRRSALERLDITEFGYAMPLQLWVQAANAELEIVEMAVPLIYLDLERNFGGSLNHAETRLNHYNEVIQTELDRLAAASDCVDRSDDHCQWS